MKSFVINSHLEAAAAEQCEIGSLKRRGSFMDFKVCSFVLYFARSSEKKSHRWLAGWLANDVKVKKSWWLRRFLLIGFGGGNRLLFLIISFLPRQEWETSESNKIGIGWSWWNYGEIKSNTLENLSILFWKIFYSFYLFVFFSLPSHIVF